MRNKLWTLGFTACLTASLFAGCGTTGVNMEETKAMQMEASISSEAAETAEVIKVREVTDDGDIQQELQMCREVVEQAQRYEAIEIFCEGKYRGEDVLNDTSSTIFLRNKKAEYNSTLIPMDGISDGIPVWGSTFATLKVEDQYFNYQPDGYVVPKDTSYEAHFGESSMTKEENEKSYEQPWLLRFQWVDEKISHISTVGSGGNKSIRIQVSEHFYENSEEENYTAEFYFKNGKFDRVELVVNYGISRGNAEGSPIIDWVDTTITESIQNTDSDFVNGYLKDIEKTALEDVKNAPKE